MKTYTLSIDEDACWGCKACEVACKQENRSPDGVKFIFISEQDPSGDEERPELRFRVNVCRHCDDPPCTHACPEDAIAKKGDAVVILNEEKCTGCRLCIDSCPYGVMAFDEDRNRAQKCNLCYLRVTKGLIPACADNVCLAHCIHFSAHP